MTDLGLGLTGLAQIQLPQAQTKSLDDVKNVPVTSSNGKNILLRNVASVTAGFQRSLWKSS